MSLTFGDLLRWNPDDVKAVAEAARARCQASQAAVKDLESLPAFETFGGEAAEASKSAIAHARTKLDLSAQDAFAVAIGAGGAYQDVQEINTEARAIVQYADESPPVTLDLDSGRVTPPSTTGMSDSEVAALKDKVTNLENRIAAVMARGEETDMDLANVLKAATGDGQPENPREEGTHDGRDLANGTLTDEERARLRKYTQLTPEQLDAWKRGELTIPAAQMDYLNQLARSLDGKSPEEIAQIQNKLGDDGGKLTNAFQLISDPKVKTVESRLKPNDPAPSKGSFDNLPAGIRDALTKYPLEWKDSGSTLGMYPVAREELGAVAAIVEKGDPAFQQGSALDTGLLKQSETILKEVQSHPEATSLALTRGGVDPTLQEMLKAAGRDQLAVHDIVAGQNGHSPNQEYIGNLLTHQWADGGSTVRSMLDNAAAGADAPNLADPGVQAVAQRAGETVHAVDQFVGSHAFDQYKKEHGVDLLHIADNSNREPGDFSDAPRHSLGQINPEIAKALAEISTPYIDDMMGQKLDHTTGFEALDARDGNQNMPNTRNLFGVIDTNKDAANILNPRADADIAQYQNTFADSVVSGQTPDARALEAAGHLQGVVDVGSNIAANQETTDKYEAAKQAYDNRNEWLQTLKKLGSEVPGVKDVLDGLDKVPGDPLHSMFVGSAPTPGDPTYLSVRSPDPVTYNIARELFERGYGNKALLSQFTNPDGTFWSYQQFENDNRFGRAVQTYLGDIANDIKADYAGTYESTLPPGQTHTGN